VSLEKKYTQSYLELAAERFVCSFKRSDRHMEMSCSYMLALVDLATL